MEKRYLKNIFILIALIFLLFLFINIFPPYPSKSQETLITEVTDGDTIVIQGGERVRLLGINTPEKGEEYYQEAKDFLKDKIFHKEVFLEKDKTDRDRYGRLLRWIWLDDELVNSEIVKNGFGIAKKYELDTKYQDLIEKAEQQAVENNVGIWSAQKTTEDKTNETEELESESKNESENKSEKTENENNDCMALGCPSGTQFAGSKNSDIYHSCICSYAQKISKENLVCFKSAEETEDSGYRACKICNPD